MRRVGVFLAGIVLFAGFAAPVALAAAGNGTGQSGGTDSPVESDIAAIEAISSEAEDAMSSVVASFETTVRQATSSSEVQQAASTARQRITDITNEALSEIRSIENGKPGALRSTANSARAAVGAARDAAMASITSIQNSFVAPTPTTTLPPNPGGSQGQGTPGAGNGQGNSQPPGGHPTPSGSNEKSAGSANPNRPGGKPFDSPLVENIVAPATLTDGRGSPSIAVTANPLVATASPDVFDAVGSRVAVFTGLPETPLSDISVSPESGFTLAPALRALVASPLRVLRTVVRVTVDGGRTVVLPLGLLTTSLLAVMFLQGRRRHEFALESAAQ